MKVTLELVRRMFKDIWDCNNERSYGVNTEKAYTNLVSKLVRQNARIILGAELQEDPLNASVLNPPDMTFEMACRVDMQLELKTLKDLGGDKFFCVFLENAIKKGVTGTVLKCLEDFREYLIRIRKGGRVFYGITHWLGYAAHAGHTELIVPLINSLGIKTDEVISCYGRALANGHESTADILYEYCKDMDSSEYYFVLLRAVEGGCTEHINRIYKARGSTSEARNALLKEAFRTRENGNFPDMLDEYLTPDAVDEELVMSVIDAGDHNTLVRITEVSVDDGSCLYNFTTGKITSANMKYLETAIKSEEKGSVVCLRYLLNKGKEDASMDLSSLLVLAVLHMNLQKVLALLKHGAKPEDRAFQALSFAVHNGAYKIVEVLLESLRKRGYLDVKSGEEKSLLRIQLDSWVKVAEDRGFHNTRVTLLHYRQRVLSTNLCSD